MDRKEKIRQYKETSLPAGVFRVKNVKNAKSFIGTSTNLPGMLNRQRFQLDNGSHVNRELQKDWKEFGPEAFTFEILDQLEPSDDPDRNQAEELQLLLDLWYNKLQASGEELYNKPIKKS